MVYTCICVYIIYVCLSRSAELRYSHWQPFVLWWAKHWPLLRLLVAHTVCRLLDGTHQAMVIHAYYEYLVIGFGNVTILGSVVWYVLSLVLFCSH